MSGSFFKQVFGGLNMPFMPTLKGVPKAPDALQPPGAPGVTQSQDKQFQPDSPDDLIAKQLKAAQLGTTQFVIPPLSTPA